MLEYILKLQIIRLDYIQSLNKKACKRMQAYDQFLASVYHRCSALKFTKISVSTS